MEIDIVYIILSLRLNTLTIGKINSLTVDSPIQPNASEQSVIPSWHAERYEFKLSLLFYIFCIIITFSYHGINPRTTKFYHSKFTSYKKHLLKQALL